jgi:pyruvate,water dikinase
LGRDIPDRIVSEIQEAFRKLGARYVAVRSSATCEDSATDAWAGQLDTYLNTTAGELLDNVRRCWASLFSARARCYRAERGLRDRNVSVAVVVQKMAQSEIAGTAFSVHPVTQNPNEMIIEAGYGLGEALVSGQITPDAYIVEKGAARIKDKYVAGQEQALYRGARGGCEWRPVAARLAGRQKLADAQILRLAEIVLRIEGHYGFPCDVEWAFERGRFYIVQSRPITTLKRR